MIIKKGQQGHHVTELQLQLAGFKGTIWDGDFGPGTELQVKTFQKDYMNETRPDGIVGPITSAAIDDFIYEFEFDLDANSLKCPCGSCQGFGNGQFKNQYRPGQPQIEAYHHYEYPGVHKAIIYSYLAAQFYLNREGFNNTKITSAYRCWHDNNAKGRISTNHMGKAIDFVIAPVNALKVTDMQICEAARNILTKTANFQMGWNEKNKKSLEPSNIAPTWIHMDVRSYDPKYLKEEHFIQSLDQLLPELLPISVA